MLVDTDVLIDYLRGEGEAVHFVEAHIDQLTISVVTVAELYQGVRDADEVEALEGLIDALRVIPVTPRIAREAGLLRRDYRQQCGCGLADCLIAATALAEEIPLRTLNVKHFPMVDDLVAPYTKSARA